jgi:hypothetical protein
VWAGIEYSPVDKVHSRVEVTRQGLDGGRFFFAKETRFLISREVQKLSDTETKHDHGRIPRPYIPIRDRR